MASNFLHFRDKDMVSNETPYLYEGDEMPKAIRITADNVDELIDWGKSVHMNLDYLRYQVEPEFPELGPYYLITDGRLVHNNVTCTVTTQADFHRNWRFADEELPFTHFNEIERI